jgi:hypothetical protein
MRIEFQRSGGFAAPTMKLSHSVDSVDLPAHEAQQLEALVKQADVANLAARAVGERPRPDAFYYRVVIEDEHGRNTIVTSDADMPPSLRPLVHWLSQHATLS